MGTTETEHVEFQSMVPVEGGIPMLAVDCSCGWIDAFPYSNPEAAHHAWVMHTMVSTPPAADLHGA